MATIAGATRILSSSLLYAAEQMRHEVRTGIVIVPEARSRDGAGRPLPVSAGNVHPSRLCDKWGRTGPVDWVQRRDFLPRAFSFAQAVIIRSIALRRSFS